MSEKSKNILIGVLLTIIIGLVILMILITTEVISFGTKNEEIDNGNDVVETTKLTESEALTIGKQLYDKMAETKVIEHYLPYCGVKYSEIRNQTMKQFDIFTHGKKDYYESKYSNIDELKNDLRNYFDEQYVNAIVPGEPITDLSVLAKEDCLFADYIIDNGKLYCRAYSAGGWNSNFLDYDIVVNSILENNIYYNVKSKYIKESVLNDLTSSCRIENINNCKEEDLEYKDTTFAIEKNSNDKWIIISTVAPHVNE